MKIIRFFRYLVFRERSRYDVDNAEKERICEEILKSGISEKEKTGARMREDG